MQLFKISLVGYESEQIHKKNRIAIDLFIDNLCTGEFWDMMKAWAKPLPKVIADGITDETALNISKHLRNLGCKIEINKSAQTTISPQEAKAQAYFDKINAPILCPVCGSNQITTGQKGYSLFTGFLGSNQTVNRCGKCGYSWKP